MKTIKNLLAAALLLSCASLAQAAATGFYVEGNLGTNFVSTNEIIVTRGLSLQGNAGYLFNQYLGLEGGYTLIDVSDINLNQIHAAVKGVVPIADKVSFFGKLGVSHLFKNGADATGLLLGTGAEYAVSDLVGINTQFAMTVLDGGSIGTLGMGVTYHFG